MKKLLGLSVALFAILLSACSKQPASQDAAKDAKATNELEKIRLVSTGPDTDIWKYIAALPETKAAGINLEVNNLNDYVVLNTAVANGEMDVNAFQSFNYLAAYNASNKAKVYPIATTYLEPMGIYTNTIKSVDAFPQGATIAIPNDTANEARALSLLQAAGLIKLKDGFDLGKGTVNDIVDNPKKLQLKPIQMTTAVRVKKDVDAIVLGNTLALEGGLNVLKDSIFRESADKSTKLYVNLLGVGEAHKNDPKYTKLGELYHLPKVQKYINDQFAGTKVAVNKPVSEFSDTH
ncbi:MULTISPECIES: MetQ/NlpA family ABC transporter substrate-binding protein [unclassified Acinetobacter]|uniref:MetQ/NlpA family ABC transporter substrate-binding protein n=1 Tax=unclassified Acinetobacter TaxID=196816 RepID=UPI002934D16E|nr:MULTISPECIES: MetQ/NlpA family ABC transporter substrate-binding protein [unclassified Acinetobacter]WOE31804.1 MetQ/NlpA family ABC transporter substrate-binding protein [Acinetobacter sp. SAAs470]WOE37271.1 MetQ/NlpA family ABC transporter substrate-binding protein [Acinetobacter sp. SAAs474]